MYVGRYAYMYVDVYNPQSSYKFVCSKYNKSDS